MKYKHFMIGATAFLLSCTSPESDLENRILEGNGSQVTNTQNLEYGPELETDFEREYDVNLVGDFTRSEYGIIEETFSRIRSIANYQGNPYINFATVKKNLSMRKDEKEKLREENRRKIERRDTTKRILSEIIGNSPEFGPTVCDEALDEMYDIHTMGLSQNDSPSGNGYDIVAIDSQNQIEDYVGRSFRNTLIHEALGHILVNDLSLPEEERQRLSDKFTDINLRARESEENSGFASEYGDNVSWQTNRKSLLQQCYDLQRGKILESIERSRIKLDDLISRTSEESDTFTYPESFGETLRKMKESTNRINQGTIEAYGRVIEDMEKNLERIDQFFGTRLGISDAKIERENEFRGEDIAETAVALVNGSYVGDSFLEEKVIALREFFERVYPGN